MCLLASFGLLGRALPESNVTCACASGLIASSSATIPRIFFMMGSLDGMGDERPVTDKDTRRPGGAVAYIAPNRHYVLCGIELCVRKLTTASSVLFRGQAAMLAVCAVFGFAGKF